MIWEVLTIIDLIMLSICLLYMVCRFAQEVAKEKQHEGQ